MKPLDQNRCSMLCKCRQASSGDTTATFRLRTLVGGGQACGWAGLVLLVQD